MSISDEFGEIKEQYKLKVRWYNALCYVFQKVICEHEIGNIFCACQDGDHMNYFAYITKDLESNKHYCHVFCVKSTVRIYTYLPRCLLCQEYHMYVVNWCPEKYFECGYMWDCTVCHEVFHEVFKHLCWLCPIPYIFLDIVGSATRTILLNTSFLIFAKVCLEWLCWLLMILPLVWSDRLGSCPRHGGLIQ